MLKVAVYSPGASAEAADAVAELAAALVLATLDAALTLDVAADDALALAEVEDALAALEDEPDAHPATAMAATSIMAAMMIPIPFFMNNNPLLPPRQARGTHSKQELLLGTKAQRQTPPALVARNVRRGSQRFSSNRTAQVPWLGDMRLTVMALARDSHPVSLARPLYAGGHCPFASYTKLSNYSFKSDLH